VDYQTGAVVAQFKTPAAPGREIGCLLAGDPLNSPLLE
jgi:hypothetical protein